MRIKNINELKIKKIQETEIPLLIESISKNLHEKKDRFNSNYWRWQYKLNPRKQSFVYAAWLNNEIVGYYHIVTHNFIAKNKKYIIGNVQDVAIDKKFQGQGIFRKLSKFANLDVNKYVDILYSFPNKKSIKTFLKYEKFNSIDCLPIHILPLKIDNIISSRIKFFGIHKILGSIISIFYKNKKKNLKNNEKVILLDHLDERICNVFKKFSEKHLYYVVRDKDYLNWRYVKSPKGNFFFLGLMKDKKISAIIVVKHSKIYNNEAFIILDFAFSENIDDLTNLINNFQVNLKNNHSLEGDFVLMSGISRYGSELKKCGFVSIPKLFIPRKLNLIARLTNRYLKFEKIDSMDWLVTLGDWDIF